MPGDADAVPAVVRIFERGGAAGSEEVDVVEYFPEQRFRLGVGQVGTRRQQGGDGDGAHRLGLSRIGSGLQNGGNKAGVGVHQPGLLRLAQGTANRR